MPPFSDSETSTWSSRAGVIQATTSSKALGATGKNLPEVVSHIVLAKQLQAKAAEMAAAAALLFSDLQAVGRFKGKVEELENYMVDYSNSQYSDWCEEVDRDLQVRNSGAIPAQFRRNSGAIPLTPRRPPCPPPARTTRPGCRCSSRGS